jgi:hypothetical protein
MAKLKFIFDNETFEIEDTINEHGVPLTGMEKANDHFDLPEGAWFGPKMAAQRIPGSGTVVTSSINTKARASRANHPHRKGSVQAHKRTFKH